jgi:hypothetical protein
MLNPIQLYRRHAKRRREEKKFQKRLRRLDDEARKTIERVHPYTMLSPDKLFALIQAVRYIVQHDVPGTLVECGVWRGGAIMAAALTLDQLGRNDRAFFLYDTFSGMPAPTARDYAIKNGSKPQEKFAATRIADDSSDWCYAGLSDVRRNLATLPYDPVHFHLIAGKVEDTIPATLPGPIALLRLDTDWYASTKHELEHLYPLLVSRGVLIIDDYYHWGGSRDAVDEYFRAHPEPILFTKVDGSMIGVKP